MGQEGQELPVILNPFHFSHLLPRKGAFFDVLERVIYKTSSGDKLPDAHISLDVVDTNRFSHHFHICLTRLANNKISTFKIKVLPSIFVQNRLEVGVIISIPK